jgi:ABC-2 type transport system permease protein
MGFDLFCLNRKFLVYNLVDRNLTVKYRRSIFGFFWTILSPLASSAIFYFVFKVVMKVEKEHYLAFIICGVFPWNYFSQSTHEATESIVGNYGLVTKIPIPIHVFPYVTALTNFITLALSVPVMFGVAYFSGVTLGWNSLWLFYFLILLMLFTYATGAILAISFVYLRDLKHALALLTQVWFYATPVLYDSGLIPEKYQAILYLNPLGLLFDGIHQTFVSGGEPAVVHLTIPVVWTLSSFLVLRFLHVKSRSGLVEAI